MVRGGHVFGKVEVVNAELVRDRRYAFIESVRQAREHSLLTRERTTQRCRVGDMVERHQVLAEVSPA